MPPKTHKQYQEGSFEANFHEIADPLLIALDDRITNLTDRFNVQKRINQEAQVRIKAQDATIRAMQRELADLQRLHSPQVIARIQNKSVNSIRDQVIDHLKENFENAGSIPKHVLISGGGFTLTNLRNYIANRFSADYSSRKIVSTQAMTKIVSEAGLNSEIETHDLLMPDTTTQRFRFYRIQLKKK